MNLFKLSISYLLHKKLHTALSIVILAFGIVIITLLLLLNEQIKTTVQKNIENVDMVVGAKGSPMQIILSSLFHIDFPTGNISLEDANFIAGHRLVKNAIPMSIGDSFEGFRIIGTDTSYYSLFHLQSDEGKLPSQTLDVVAGNNAAKQLGLKVGDHLESSHGFADDGGHEDHHYTVTGILKATGRIHDNLLFTPLSSYWAVHETDTSELFITNELLQFRSPMAAVKLPRLINNTSNLQAAMPPFEITKLLGMLGTGSKFLNLIAFLLIGVAALSIFISMYSTLNERLYDMAIFRALGATKRKLFLFILSEGVMISLIGSVLGIGLSHLILWSSHQFIGGEVGTLLSGSIFSTKELYILMLGITTGIVGALLPAINIYRSDISRTLAEM